MRRWQADRVPYLAVDTSAGLAVAVVADDGSVAARAADAQPRRHAEQLGPAVASVLETAGLAPKDLTGVVVGTGPAPFTGLRAGLVTARVLGYTLGVPVLGVPSLAAVALRAFDLLDADDPDAPGHVVVVTDARRREVFWARYARDPALGVRAVAGPGVAAPGDVAADLASGHQAALAGRGATLVPHPSTSALAGLDPDPVALVTVSLARQAHDEPNPVEPLYLRRPDAVPPASAPRVPQ